MLAAGAVLSCALAPVLSHLLRSGLPEGPGAPTRAGRAGRARPSCSPRSRLTGYYPVLPWTTYLLAGMAVGRLDLRRVRVAAALLVGGTVLAVAAAVASAWLLGPRGGAAVLGAEALAERNYGTTPTDSWWWLAIVAPHSGTPFDLAHTTGTALAALGAMLLLARLSRALVWVPAAVGSIPLTLYTLHVLLLSGYSGENAAGAVLVRLWARARGRRGVLGVLLRLLGGAVRWRRSCRWRAGRCAGRSTRGWAGERAAPRGRTRPPVTERPTPPCPRVARSRRPIRSAWSRPRTNPSAARGGHPSGAGDRAAAGVGGTAAGSVGADPRHQQPDEGQHRSRTLCGGRTAATARLRRRPSAAPPPPRPRRVCGCAG